MSGHRRLVSESSAPVKRPRPLSIFSPPNSPNTKSFDQIPPQFATVIKSLEAKKEKIYHEGHLLKLDDLSTDGSQLPKSTWQDIYASLSGTVLSYWPAAQFEDAETVGQVTRIAPKFLNITDAQIYQAPDTNDIAISTTGRNRYILRSPPEEDPNNASKWLIALRLSMFERARMQEIYTSNLFIKFQTKDVLDFPAKEEKWSGFVDARLTGVDVTQRQWKRFWCSILTGPKKSFLSKRASRETTENEREIRFYASRKDKAPEVVMNGIFAAYCTYPEHVSLIESAGMIKIEGQVRSQVAYASTNSHGCALIIPATAEVSKRLSLPTTPTTSLTNVQRLLKLLFCVWSTFDLYNRPRNLLLNVDHVEALGNAQGYVDLSMQQVADRISAVADDTEAAWRKSFREQAVLTSHYAEVLPNPNSNLPVTSFRRTGNDRRVVSEGAIIPPRRALVTSIEEDEELERLNRSDKSQEPFRPDLEPRVQKFGMPNSLKPDAIQRQKAEVLHDSFFDGLDQQRAVAPDTIVRKPGSVIEGPSANPTSTRSIKTTPIGSHADNLSAQGLQDPDQMQTGSLPPPLQVNTTDVTANISSQDNHSLFTVSPIEPKYAEPKPNYVTRRALFTRTKSHDSHISQDSDASVYSDGLDPTALDLISPVAAHSIYNPSRGRGAPSRVDREGSIYSVQSHSQSVHDTDDERSELAQTQNDKQTTDNYVVGKSQMQRRASAVEALKALRKELDDDLHL